MRGGGCAGLAVGGRGGRASAGDLYGVWREVRGYHGL